MNRRTKVTEAMMRARFHSWLRDPDTTFEDYCDEMSPFVEVVTDEEYQEELQWHDTDRN